MPCYVVDGVAEPDVLAQIDQSVVLRLCERVTLQSFQFYADRVVIALLSTTVGGLPGVPGSEIAVHELP